MIAIAALVWAFASIQIKKAMNNPTSDSTKPLTPLAITVWASIVGMAFLTPLAGVETYKHGIPIIDMYTWVAIVFLAIGSTVISYVWFAQGIKELGESYAALYVYLVPPFGIISGWVLLDEKLGWSLLIALILIIGGVALAQSENKQETSQAITENL
jgi:drug/metabolite transporter (DMT)-like permease